MLAGTDSNGWDRDGICDLLRDVGEHNLQHHGKCAGFFDGSRVGEQSFGLQLRAPLDSIATFLAHTLGKHADVRHERNAFLCDRFDLRDMTRAAFELHRLRARVDKLFRRRDRLFGGVVGVNWHVRDEQRLFCPACRRARVMQHLFQRYRRRVLVPKHNHAQRVADQDDVDAGFVEQPRRGIIVCGQRGDFLAALFHLAKIFHGVARKISC